MAVRCALAVRMWARSCPEVLFWEVGTITQTSYRNWLWFIPSSRPVADCVSCAWTRRAFRCGGRCAPDSPGWSQGLPKPPAKLLSALSTLSCYVSTADGRERELLEAVAPNALNAPI